MGVLFTVDLSRFFSYENCIWLIFATIFTLFGDILALIWHLLNENDCMQELNSKTSSTWPGTQLTPAIIAVEIIVARNMLAFHTRAHYSKNMGTIFLPSWPCKKMPLLYVDYVKSAAFGSEKKF